MKKIMTKKNFMAVAFMAITGISGQVSAQDTSTGAPQKRNKNNSSINVRSAASDACVGKITGTATGCVITFSHVITKPKDQRTGGVQSDNPVHKPFYFSVRSFDGGITAVDDWKAPVARKSETVSMSFAQVSVKYFYRGRLQELPVEDGKFSLPLDCPDGESNLVLSWIWAAQDGGVVKPCTVAFTCTCSGGYVVKMAINEKGTAGTKGTKKSSN